MAKSTLPDGFIPAEVPVRFFAIVVREEAAERQVKGGAATLAAALHGQRAQGLLHWARMSMSDAQALIKQLERRSLTFAVDGVAQDIAILDMMRGALVPVPWLQIIGVPGQLRVTLDVP